MTQTYGLPPDGAPLTWGATKGGWGWMNNSLSNSLALNPFMCPPLPRHTYIDTIFMGQAGHPFTFAGTGAVGNNNDTVDYAIGTEAIYVTTGGAGAQAKISGTFTSALNLTGKYLTMWVKLVNYPHVLGGYPRVYLGDAALTNAYYWKITEAAGQPWALDGEWHKVTLPFGTATAVGTPSRASLAALTIQVYDDSAGQVTLHLGGMATVNEPSTKWPSGVITLSFDDGYMSQFTTARPYMDKYGYRATSFVITETLWNHGAYGGYVDLPSCQQLELQSGWEIATHAYTAANHNASYTAIGQAAALADAANAKTYLQSNGFRAPNLFAYPLGNYDSGTLANTRALFTAGRTISNYGGFPDETVIPADISRIRAQAISTATSLATLEAWVDRIAANAEWGILHFHDIQAAASGNLQFSTANFQSLMDYIAAKPVPVRLMSEVLNSTVSLI